ncbi:hypothetical protein TcasGA2_TC007218 [Tribolium castaneum]|uniref:Uncharacterized protein n=1 Tax=Tribolium castaneum TaxID=7070 RepID=D2A0R5_TRICA|nr:hypothetical protein TcasGA2_TC007218 [Tribolium castaneum]
MIKQIVALHFTNEREKIDVAGGRRNRIWDRSGRIQKCSCSEEGETVASGGPHSNAANLRCGLSPLAGWAGPGECHWPKRHVAAQEGGPSSSCSTAKARTYLLLPCTNRTEGNSKVESSTLLPLSENLPSDDPVLDGGGETMVEASDRSLLADPSLDPSTTLTEPHSMENNTNSSREERAIYRAPTSSFLLYCGEGSFIINHPIVDTHAVISDSGTIV